MAVRFSWTLGPTSPFNMGLDIVASDRFSQLQVQPLAVMSPKAVMILT